MLDLTALKKAVSSLKQAVKKMEDEMFIASLDETALKIFKAGVIQNFEFTYELCWKFIKRWLSENIGASYIDGLSRKSLFRKAAESRLIENIEDWIVFHKAGNITSHTYNAEIAEDIYTLSAGFLKKSEKLLKVLETKND